MLRRLTAIFAVVLPFSLLTACGTAATGATISIISTITTTPTISTITTIPTITTTPTISTIPTLPAGQRPPRPQPDPAAVIAGAPLRATLLTQIDAYERALTHCAASVTPSASCPMMVLRLLQDDSPELATYVAWRDAIWYCISDGQGGYMRLSTYVYYPPTVDELRNADRLAVYVSGTPWCGVSGPR